jgi:hypothetical protein
MYRYRELKDNTKIQLIDNKTDLVIGHVEFTLEGGFTAIPYYSHRQKSSFDHLPFAKGYIASCFYNRGARCKDQKSTSQIIELSLKL